MLKELLYVFSQNYKEEMQYLDLCENIKQKIALISCKYDKIERFSEVESNCKIHIIKMPNRIIAEEPLYTEHSQRKGP